MWAMPAGGPVERSAELLLKYRSPTVGMLSSSGECDTCCDTCMAILLLRLLLSIELLPIKVILIKEKILHLPLVKIFSLLIFLLNAIQKCHLIP